MLTVKRWLLAYDRVLCRPTWTGRAGSAGVPRHPTFGTANRARSGTATRAAAAPAKAAVFASGAAPGVSARAAPTSAQVIAHHRQREAEAAQEAPGGTAASAQASDLLARLISYLSSQPSHRASSADVLAAFDADAAKQHGALLKQTLKRVATLHKRREGAEWVLKDEFL
jgi:hypothetical protein